MQLADQLADEACSLHADEAMQMARGWTTQDPARGSTTDSSAHESMKPSASHESADARFSLANKEDVVRGKTRHHSTRADIKGKLLTIPPLSMSSVLRRSKTDESTSPTALAERLGSPACARGARCSPQQRMDEEHAPHPCDTATQSQTHVDEEHESFTGSWTLDGADNEHLARRDVIFHNASPADCSVSPPGRLDIHCPNPLTSKAISSTQQVMPSRSRFSSRNLLASYLPSREASPYGSDIESSISFTAHATRLPVSSPAVEQASSSLLARIGKSKYKTTSKTTSGPKVARRYHRNVYGHVKSQEDKSDIVPRLVRSSAKTTTSGPYRTHQVRVSDRDCSSSDDYFGPHTNPSDSNTSSRATPLGVTASYEATIHLGGLSSNVQFDTTAATQLENAYSDESEIDGENDSEEDISSQSDTSSEFDAEETDVSTPDDCLVRKSLFGHPLRPELSRGVSEGLEDCSNDRLVLAAACEKKVRSSSDESVDITASTVDVEWLVDVFDDDATVEEPETILGDVSLRPQLSRGTSEGLADISNDPLVLAASCEKRVSINKSRSPRNRSPLPKGSPGQEWQVDVFTDNLVATPEEDNNLGISLRPELSRGCSEGLEDISDSPLVHAAAWEKKLSISSKSKSTGNMNSCHRNSSISFSDHNVKVHVLDSHYEAEELTLVGDSPRRQVSRGVSQGLEDCSNCPLVLAAAKEKRLSKSKKSHSVSSIVHNTLGSSKEPRRNTWQVDCFEHSPRRSAPRFQLVSTESTPSGTRRGSIDMRGRGTSI